MYKQNKILATYAVTDENSKGRKYKERQIILEDSRDIFQIDYSRVIDSSGFKRLKDKTQVFQGDEGDLLRTRQIHSLEVAQASACVAEALNLNTYLAQTLALAHDLGHAPFGHVGQDVLNHLMADWGGFEHNLQTLRIVDELENKYLDFKGLNLNFETREGILKHCVIEHAEKLGDIAQRHVLGKSPTLEAQLVNKCDAIAYTHSDIEDGFRCSYLDVDSKSKHYLSVLQLKESVPLFNYYYTKLLKDYNVEPDNYTLFHSTVRLMYKHTINDFINNSKNNLLMHNIQTLDDVKNNKEMMSFSNEMREQHALLKKFLRENLYTHKILIEKREKQKEIIQVVFNYYKEHIEDVPNYNKSVSDLDNYRNLCDYVAGMTDNFITKKYNSALNLSRKFII